MPARLRLSFVLLLLVSLATLVALAASLRDQRPLPEDPVASPSAVRRERAEVRTVLDGATVELASGERVRYLGVLTPPADDPAIPSYLALAATEANRALVAGRTLFLEADPAGQAADGLAARYVFLEDGTFVQAELVRGGYVRVDPDALGRYQSWLRELEEEARRARIGLWQVVTLGPTPTSLTLSTLTLPTLAAGGEAQPAFACDPAAVNISGALDAATAEQRRHAPEATVVFEVTGAVEDGGDLILTSGRPPDRHFRVLVPAAIRALLPQTAATDFVGRCVAATGRLQPYRTTSQVVVGEPGGVVVVR